MSLAEAAATEAPRLKVMRTPREVGIDITARCNLRCTYCYHFAGPGDVAAELPADAWLTFFEQLGRLRVMRVTLAGGEPFLRKDLPRLVDGIVKNRMRFAILSNGTLIDDDAAALLAATGRCDYVQVSIDGATAPVHDACRGPGSFHRAVRGLRALQRAGVPAAVRVTIHRHNVDDLANIARFLLEDLGLAGFSTNAASYLGLGVQNADDVGLTTAQRTSAMAALTALNRRYDKRIGAQAGPLAEAYRWCEMEAARRQNKPSLALGGSLTACGCVMDKIAVRADGAVVPCTMLSHIEMGRITTDDLEPIWQHHPQMTAMRERRFIPLSDFAYCRDCPYIDYCTGNCPGLAYTHTGRVHHPSPDACLRRFLEDGGRLPEL